MYVIQWDILLHLCLDYFYRFSNSMLVKGFRYLFALSASGLGSVSCVRLGNRKDFQSVISVCSILNTQLRACVLPPLPLEGNDK